MACEYCGVIEGGLHEVECPNGDDALPLPVEQVDARELAAIEQYGENSEEFQLMAGAPFWWRYKREQV